MEIVLKPGTLPMDRVVATLSDESEQPVLHWTADLQGRDTMTVVLQSDQIPDGVDRLDLADSNGKVFDQRFLEFLPAPEE